MPNDDYFEDLIKKREAEEERKKRKAVALAYDLDKDPAPRVLASGKGTMAEQIIKIAEEQGIHIHKDENLVEILGALEVDSFIPLEAYMAVAEILSYLYKTKNKNT